MFTLAQVAEMLRAGASRRDGNKSIADFDRTIVKEKGITLLRADASAVSAPRDGTRLALQVHTSPAALLALAAEAMELGHSSVFLTLTVAVRDARAAVQAAKAPKPEPAKPEPAKLEPAKPAEPAVPPAIQGLIE